MVFAVVAQDQSLPDRALIMEFAKMMYEEARSKGLMLGQPTDMRAGMLTGNAEEKIREMLTEARDRSCNFVLFISSDSLKMAHGESCGVTAGFPFPGPLKFFERQICITTQDVKMSNATAVVRERKMQTLENIVMKTNVKLGGLNYMLRPLTQ